jgi:cation transport ATPase
MFCIHCGTSLPEAAAYCSACGKQVTEESSSIIVVPPDERSASPPSPRPPRGSIDAPARWPRLWWPAVFRDVALVWVLTLLAGFVVGLGGPTGERRQLPYGAASFVFGTVAFTIAGCLTPVHRFRHLSVVAAITWATSIVNVLLGLGTIGAWTLSIVFSFALVAAGGSLSFLFVRQPQTVSRGAAVEGTQR